MRAASSVLTRGAGFVGTGFAAPPGAPSGFAASVVGGRTASAGRSTQLCRVHRIGLELLRGTAQPAPSVAAMPRAAAALARAASCLPPSAAAAVASACSSAAFSSACVIGSTDGMQRNIELELRPLDQCLRQLRQFLAPRCRLSTAEPAGKSM